MLRIRKISQRFLLFGGLVLTVVTFYTISQGLARLIKVPLVFIQHTLIDHEVDGRPFLKEIKAAVTEFHPLTVYEAFAHHRLKALETCNNSCDSPGCQVTTIGSWNALNKQSLLPYTPFLANGEYIFPWEKTYLSRRPLDDPRTLPDLNLSSVVMSDGSREGIVRCNVSDTLQGRVDVVDGYGDVRTGGDDEVRVWIKSSDQDGFASAGNVTDLKNGSYLFTFRCLWPGNSSLNVAVAYPREFIRAVIHQTHIGVARFMAMTFNKENIHETTICWPTPNIPGRPCVCNMTQYGHEIYYCGRPKDPRLSCDDWTKSEVLQNLPQPHGVTKAEDDLIKKSTSLAVSTLINHGIRIITEKKGTLPRQRPCHQAPKRPTWDTTMPKGYWSPGLVWNSLLCQDAGKITTNWTLNCLRNTTVWIFGDSNGFRIFQSFLELTRCNPKVGAWPFHSWCFIPNIGLNITIRTHETPLYWSFSRQDFPAPVSAVLDTVPDFGHHVIIMHYYLHYAPSHLSVLYLRMKKLRAAVEKLLDRNKNVLVGIRGPHISTRDWDINHAIGGDPLGPRYVEIIKSTFRGLDDRVKYLDLWEMSIGIENSEYHPPYQLTREMIKDILSSKCN